MSTWIILSWIFVVILTAINIFVFLKLKQATEQMMKMAFPGVKNMNEALAKMQQMTGGMGQGGPRMGGFPSVMKGGGKGGGSGKDAQLKAAMDMLQQMQKGRKR